MATINVLVHQPVAAAIGWALLQFVWQGLAIGLAAAAVLATLRRSAADVRYVVGTIALALMLTLPVVTALQRYAVVVPHAGSTPAAALPMTPESGVVAAPSKTHSQFAAAATAVPSIPRGNGPILAAEWSRLTRTERALPIVMVVWFGGVVILSLRLFTGWLWVRRVRTHGVLPAELAWNQVAQRLARKLHISRAITLFESTLVDVPTVVGWLKPVVLMPVSALGGLAPEQLEVILAHELAHIRRHDYAVNLLQTLVETLLFYHPAVWWLSRRVRAERENCCDDLAVALCGDPVAYANALADLETLRSTEPSVRRLNRTALAATGGSLVHRVRRLLGAPAHTSIGPVWLAGTVALVVIACFAFSVDGVRAQQTDRSAQTSSESAATQATASDDAARAQEAIARAATEAQAEAAAAAERAKASMIRLESREERRAENAQAQLARTQAKLVMERQQLDAGLATRANVRAAEAATRAASAQLAATEQQLTGTAVAMQRESTAAEANAVASAAAAVAVVSGASQSVHLSQTDSSGNWVWSNNGEKLEVTYSGTFDFSDDDSDITQISPGGMFRISDGAWFGRHSVELREHNGQIERHYYVNGSERPFEPEGRQWLHDNLPKFVRNTGIAAPARVARFLKSGGVPAVLSEISRVDGSYVKGIYYRELFKQASLTPSQYRDVMAQASREMRGSDYALGQLLIAIADKLPNDAGSRDAYFAAAGSLSSSYETRQVYTQMLKRGPVSDQTLVGILEHVGTMNSDYDRSELLRAILAQQPLDDRTNRPFFSAMAGLHSDYERQRVLSAALERSRDRATLEAVLTEAATINGSYEKSMLLQEVLKSSSVEGPLRAPFFAAVNGLNSSYERGRVLKAVAIRADASDDTLRGVLDLAQSMSGYDLSQLLIAVAKAHALSGSLRDAYIQDADKLSGYDQGQVMTALVKAEGRR